MPHRISGPTRPIHNGDRCFLSSGVHHVGDALPTLWVGGGKKPTAGRIGAIGRAIPIASGSIRFLQQENAGCVIPRRHSFEYDEILLSLRDQRIFDPGTILTGCDLAKVWGDRCQLPAFAFIQKPGEYSTSDPVDSAGRNRRLQALAIAPRTTIFRCDVPNPADRLPDP